MIRYELEKVISAALERNKDEKRKKGCYVNGVSQPEAATEAHKCGRENGNENQSEPDSE